MDGNFSYLDIGEEIIGNYLLENFTELENLSVEYPELIYDGPFSDGIDRAEIKGLSGGEITPEVAREIFRASFAKFSLEEDPISDGETNGDIECYNVYSSVKGENLYAQVSKVGGKIIMFSYAGSCLSTDITKEFAIEKAKEFLESLDIFGMTPVWINLSNNVYTINFAFEDNGVIVYSDLVKIRVCAETAMVIGLEATEYYTNHTERIIPSPTLTKESAMEKVSSNIEILTSRLALVPVGRSGERLCYEFSGEYDGSTFYAYIDAENGRQVELFKVIKAGEGELLM
jgi:germination protein YpeB